MSEYFPSRANMYDPRQEFEQLGIEPPEAIVDSIVDITYNQLCNMDIELLMLDIDGTITEEMAGLKSVDSETLEHINDLSQYFHVCFVTMGNKSTEVLKRYFNQDYQVFTPASLPDELWSPGAAPWTTKDDNPEFFFGQALEHFGIAPENALVIGNEIRADVTGPRTLGIRSILVDGYNKSRIERCLADPEFIHALGGDDKLTWRYFLD
ncbi:MAG: HAD hydrolase-like protein [Actinobacteria bacterium]|nr:HAD hydrolase-like protein [Actinomycetota bacterium]